MKRLTRWHHCLEIYLMVIDTWMMDTLPLSIAEKYAELALPLAKRIGRRVLVSEVLRAQGYHELAELEVFQVSHWN